MGDHPDFGVHTFYGRIGNFFINEAENSREMILESKSEFYEWLQS